MFLFSIRNAKFPAFFLVVADFIPNSKLGIIFETSKYLLDNFNLRRQTGLEFLALWHFVLLYVTLLGDLCSCRNVKNQIKYYENFFTF